MKTRELIEKYRTIIRKLINKYPTISRHELLKELLNIYLGKDIKVLGKFYSISRSHVEFAVKLKNEINENPLSVDLLKLLDEYTQKNKFNKSGDFYALLISYFIYFKDFYDFYAFKDTLQNQLYKPISPYIKSRKKIEIKNILKIIENHDLEIALDGLMLLKEISIPSDQVILVAEKLLDLINHTQVKYLSISGVLKGFAFSDYACKALSRMDLPTEIQIKFVRLLLHNPVFYDNELAIKTLAEVTIPDNCRNEVIDYLRNMHPKIGTIEYDLLKKIADEAFMHNYETIEINIALNELFNFNPMKLSNPTTDEKSIRSILSQVGAMHIPMQYIDQVLKKLFSMIEFKNLDDLMAIIIEKSVFVCLGQILLNGLLTDAQKEQIIDKLLQKIKGNLHFNFYYLIKVNMPKEKLLDAIDAALDMVENDEYLYDPLDFLANISIPINRHEKVLSYLLPKLDKLENISFSYACCAIANTDIPPQLVDELIKKILDKAKKSENIYIMQGVFYFFQKVSIPEEVRKETFNALFELANTTYSFSLIAKIPLLQDEREKLLNGILSRLVTTKNASNVNDLLESLYLLELDSPPEESIRIQIKLEAIRETTTKSLEPHYIKYLEKLHALNESKIRLGKALPKELVRHVLAFNKLP